MQPREDASAREAHMQFRGKPDLLPENGQFVIHPARKEAALDRDVVFVGDRDDPWSARIAARLGHPATWLDRASASADALPAPFASARLIIYHAAAPTRRDIDALTRARAGGSVRIVFCAGSMSRYHQLEPLAAICDAVVSETTALAAIDRQLALVGGTAWSETVPHRGAITVISSNFEMRAMLVEAVGRGGYIGHPARNWAAAPPLPPALWDVPILEPDWPESLARESKRRPVFALAGFLDREIADEMLRRGARCCLDLPCDPADLRWVLRRDLSAIQQARA